MPAVGIDISDESIKFVLLKHKNHIELESFGIRQLPEGAVERGTIKKPDDVVAVLKKIQREYGYEFAHVSLPEEHAYLFQTIIETQVSAQEARAMIEFALKENVPIPPEEALFDYMLLSDSNQTATAAMVSVYPQRLIEDYVVLFKEARLMPLSFEIEGQATARALLPQRSKETVIIVDLGKTGAGISIVSRGVLSFTATLEVCGDDFTHAIEKQLNVSAEEAERLKREKGFANAPENQTLMQAMLGTASALRDEINKHYIYWQMHSEEGEERKVERIILCGGNANLKGLLEYLQVTMPIPVEEANIWTNITSFDDYIPQITKSESFHYGTAVGLALRSLARGE